MKHLLLTLCLLLSVPTWAEATDRYVGQSASGAGTGTSPANLCGGLVDADCTPVAGDTVYLCGFFTTIQTLQAVNGTSALPITYDGSCPGGSPMVMAHDGAADRAFYINGRSWIIAKNMTLSGDTTCSGLPCALFAVNSTTDSLIDNITVSGNRIDGLHIRGSSRVTATNINAHDIGEAGFSNTCIHITNTSIDITVDGFTTYNCVWAGVFVEGFSVQSSLHRITIKNGETYNNGSGVYVQIADVVLVQNVHAHHNTNTVGAGEQYGVGVRQSTNVIIERNHIHDNGLHGIEYWADASLSSNNGVVRSNTIHENGKFIPENGHASIRAVTGFAQNLKIYGNKMYNESRIFHVAKDPGETSVFANNTISDYLVGLEFYDSDIPGVDQVTGWDFRNNIFDQGKSGYWWLFSSVAGVSNTFAKNNWWGAGGRAKYGGTDYTSATITTVDSTALTVDPLFISSTDLRTTGSSSLRRAGISGSLCADVRGRPCWSPPDIGAYQATSGDPAVTRSAAATRSAASTRSAAGPRALR